MIYTARSPSPLIIKAKPCKQSAIERLNKSNFVFLTLSSHDTFMQYGHIHRYMSIKLGREDSAEPQHLDNSKVENWLIYNKCTTISSANAKQSCTTPGPTLINYGRRDEEDIIFHHISSVAPATTTLTLQLARGWFDKVMNIEQQ